MTTCEIHYNPNPTAKELKHLLDIDPRTKAIPAYKKAIELKLQSLTQEPTTIEKTMTPAQLYASDSPLWALNYNPDMIKQMLNHLRNYPKSEEIFNIVLEEVSNGIVTINKFGLAN